MGKLVEQTLRTMYQGVSRQPNTVRLPGQVEEAENAMFSVVSGGFSKRPGTQHLASTSMPSEDTALYGYERDANEKYLIMVNNSTLLVYNTTGSQIAVAFPDGTAYLSTYTPSQDLAFTTIADHTFISNKQLTVAMSDAGVFDAATMPHVLVREADGTFTFRASTTYTERPVIEPDYYSSPNITYTLTDDAGGRFAIDETTGLVTVADPTLVNATTETSYPITAEALCTDGTSNTKTFNIYVYASSVGELSDDDEDLNSPDVNGMVFEGAQAGDLVGLTVFAEDRLENAQPKTPTLPTDLIPTPDFVGHKISDITFFRNRLGIVADETVYFSQASDYTNFWPKTVAQVIDSDAFGRTASSSQVNLIRFVVPFRKALFCSADTAQFELSADAALTPAATTIDISTQYASEPLCRPIGFRDELYFASSSGNSASLFEYYYSDTSVGHTANDVLIHASGYVPAPITQLVGDTVTGTIFTLSGSDRSSVYVYRTFWSGEEKAQSAWGKWTFGVDAIVHSLTVLKGELFVVLTRDGTVMIEKMSLNIDECPAHFKLPVRLDSMQHLDGGVYDSLSDLTTYTSQYELGSFVAVVDTDMAPLNRQGCILSVLSSTGNEFTVSGDYSQTPIYVGIPYNMVVELSKQYLREGDDDITVTTGRLQLKRIYFDYKDSAFLQVVVTPHMRDPKTYTFNGSVLGGYVQTTPDLSSGVFDTPVRSKGSTAKIQITNYSYLPCTITSAKWKGFFNEITRQE